MNLSLAGQFVLTVLALTSAVDSFVTETPSPSPLTVITLSTCVSVAACSGAVRCLLVVVDPLYYGDALAVAVAHLLLGRRLQRKSLFDGRPSNAGMSTNNERAGQTQVPGALAVKPSAQYPVTESTTHSRQPTAVVQSSAPSCRRSRSSCRAARLRTPERNEVPSQDSCSIEHPRRIDKQVGKNLCCMIHRQKHTSSSPSFAMYGR